MNVLEQEHSFLTREEAENIESKSERDFALRCMAVGCLLVHQVPVGMSTIDFLVINPKRHHDQFRKELQGKLVEVTLMPEGQKDQIHVTRQRNKKSRKVLNTTGKRKDRQIAAMQNSGYKWTILYGETVRKIMQGQ